MSDIEEFLGTAKTLINRLKSNTSELRDWLDGMNDEALRAELQRIEEIADDAAWRMDVLQDELALRQIAAVADIIPRIKGSTS